MQTVKFPPNRIILDAEGAVVESETWVLWNGEPWLTIHIKRVPTGAFRSHISDPGGGGQRVGTLEEALEGLHPDVSAQYITLFGLNNPTEADLAAVGFEKYEIQHYVTQ